MIRWLAASSALALLACHPGGPVASTAPTSDCPGAWLEAPPVASAIAVPEGDEHVVFRASATGTQDYACSPSTADAGASYAWSLTGPEATLSDCHQATIGHHFASDAGAGKPEWQTVDGAYVVAHKMAASPADGGAVPWLLLRVDSRGGTAPIATAAYVQRVRTTGGVAPTAPCDASGAGTVVKVPYAADYYFYAP